MRKRVASAMLLLLVATACDGGDGAEEVATPGPAESPMEPAAVRGQSRAPRGPFEEAACSLPEEHLRRIWRGHHPSRSGQIQLVPEKPDLVGTWLSHSGPWQYVQHVPLLFYGPGRIAEGKRAPSPATLADIAPTHAALLGFDFEAPDGEVLTEAVLPEATPPKLIVTMVWDSAGQNVLEEHPDAWPTLRRLMDRGTWFENAIVGSSPTVTPAVHTTIGTGAFPLNHGIVDIRFNLPDGSGVGARGEAVRYLELPSLADVYDAAHDNEPIIGLVGSEGTLGMLGRGGLWPGADRHIAATRTADRWFLEGTNAEAFRFPDYAEDFPGLEEAIRRLDLADGVLDGKWHDVPIPQGGRDLAATPAFGEYQRSLVREVITREGFGTRDGGGADLLYINYREIDAVGHRFSMNSPQMEAVVRTTDDSLADLIRLLDRQVGEGEWVLTVTADHGSTPHTDLTGAFVVNPKKLTEDIEAEFGEGVVSGVRVTQIWMDMERLAEERVPLRDVVSFLADYAKSDHDPSQLSGPGDDGPAFKAVFPGAILDDPPCLSGISPADEGDSG